MIACVAAGRVEPLAGLGRKLPRVAFFRIKGNRAIGWKGIDRQRPLPGIARLSLPLNEPSALQIVTASAGYYLGPLQDTPVNHAIQDAMGGRISATALLMPLFVGGRIVSDREPGAGEGRNWIQVQGSDGWLRLR